MKNPPYLHAEFLTSAQNIKQAPKDDGVEVAFVGRSNVGKSSVINSLTNQKSLAKTSRTPGRTQLINFFTVNEHTKLVDLPGYGFAKVAASVHKLWKNNLEEFLEKRQALQAVVLISDARHPLKELDEIMLNFLLSLDLKVLLLLNKSDKLSKNQAKNTLEKTKEQLALMDNNVNLKVLLFSSLKKEGVSECLMVLDKFFKFKD